MYQLAWLDRIMGKPLDVLLPVCRAFLIINPLEQYHKCTGLMDLLLSAILGLNGEVCRKG